MKKRKELLKCTLITFKKIIKDLRIHLITTVFDNKFVLNHKTPIPEKLF